MSQPTPPSASEPSGPIADPQSTSPFNKVPLEVLLRISNLLNTTDLGALRLTCRSIEQSLFNTFMKEYFTKRQFMLTEFSLQTLVDISNSRLSDCLDHVIIGLNCFTRHYFPPGKEACEIRYREAQTHHSALLSSGLHLAMLTDAFRNLKNLRTVGIRDYNSKARGLRDGYGAAWASYGATTLEKETEVNLFRIPIDEMQAYTNHVFISLFTALGNAGARPKAFELLRKGHGVPSDGAFDLFFTHYLIPKTVPVLQNLESFLCVVNVANGPFRTTAPVSGDTAFSRLRHDYFLRLFLGHMPNLKHLRLNFSHPGINSDAVDHFINWLGTPVSSLPMPPVSDSQLPPPPPPPPVAFPHLEELNLGFVDVEPRRLVQLVRKLSPTLRRLTLWKLTLWNKAADVQQNIDERRDHYSVNLWAKTLKGLCGIPNLNLHHIKIGSPAQRTFMANTKVWFHNKGDSLDDKVDQKEYTGIDWKHFVEELAGQVKAELPTKTDEYEDLDEYESDTEMDEDLEGE
ncbi:F-box domain-containing protein [Colletotrichum zoysiae]|uniref:F-box domain-containing protein n=1 Tax=Colletotrichum zoysiae TaxID=1216348 RepID=A0AAD9HPS6_9PEZI|nr:F-box domain-containing protein [Colletotrichum zoysiae]